MAWLSPILKDISDHEVSRRSVHPTVIAAMTSPCSDLGNALQCESMSPSFLAHMRHEAKVRTSDVRLRIRATLGALQEHHSRLLLQSTNHCPPRPSAKMVSRPLVQIALPACP